MPVPLLDIECISHIESSGSYKHGTRRLEPQTFDFESVASSAELFKNKDTKGSSRGTECRHPLLILNMSLI